MAFNTNNNMRSYRLEDAPPDSPEDRAGRFDVMKPEIGVNRGPARSCPRCNRTLGMLTWLPPYGIEIDTWGKQYGDIARTGDDLIVSERFLKAYQQDGLKGVESFEPVKVVKVRHRRGKPRDSLPPYFKATVVRSATTIDQKASGYEWGDESKICPVCLFDTLKRYKRLVIDRDSWTGEDALFPRGGKGLIVSERFVSMCQSQQLHGAIFIPSESEAAGYDSYPWETQAESRS